MQIEDRVAILEAEVAQLKDKLEPESSKVIPWWQKSSGSFANSSTFDEAMKLGHEYRESLRPDLDNQCED
jgi:hypothetical protein